jgi:hypothetical protein
MLTIKKRSPNRRFSRPHPPPAIDLELRVILMSAMNTRVFLNSPSGCPRRCFPGLHPGWLGDLSF